MSSSGRKKGRRGSPAPEPVPDAPAEVPAEAPETALPDGSEAVASEAAEPGFPAGVEPEAGRDSEDAPAAPSAAQADAPSADAPDAPLDPDDDPAVPGEDTPEGPGLEKAPPKPLGAEHLETILESLVFVADRPLPANRLARIARAPLRDVEPILERLVARYRGRGIELVQVAGGYQFRSAAASAPFVRDLVAKRPVRLTRAQIETLAIMAYRQPLTRPELEDVRGVDSGSALKVLLEKGLTKILGRKDEAGRPLLYGTTPAFLELFGLSSLSELPTLREHTELTEESRALFARRMSENIESIGDMDLETHHYTDDEIEAAEKAATRQREIDEGVPDQRELDVDAAAAGVAAGDGEEDGQGAARAAGDGEDDE